MDESPVRPEPPTRSSTRLVARVMRHDDKLLESTVRRQLLDLVEKQPGIPIGQVGEELQLGWGTLYHHVTKLSRAGLIRAEVHGRRRLLYPASARVATMHVAARSLLRGATARRIALAIAEPGPHSILELSERLGESPRVVYYHVKRLLEAGVLLSDSRTRHTGLTVAQDASRLLEEIARQPAVPDKAVDGPTSGL